MLFNGEVKIRCPRCEWEPQEHDRWCCYCGHTWNTFDTGGKCPKCRFVHKNTQCRACHEWSPHADWYVDFPEVKLEIEEMMKSGSR